MTSKRQKEKGWILPDEITNHELVCVQMLIPNDPDYIAAFKGNLDQLTKSWNWERSYTEGDDRAARASVYWRKIIFNSLEIGHCEGTNRICVDYTASAPLVTYAPVDPFKEPDTIPNGYFFPPYVVIQPSDIIGALAGYRINDVLTTIARIPPSIPTILSKGFPNFRITLPSAGDVTLYLLAIELGGSAIIIIDGIDNHNSKIINLQRIPFSDDPREIDVPLKLTGEGQHTIDVTFVPELVPEPRFGGGFRGFEFCSEQTFNSHIVTECEDEMNLRIKPDDCTIIQAQCSDGTWQDWYDPSCKANGANGTAQQGQDDNPPKAGESKCYPMVLQSNDVKFVPIPVNDGDTITITNASGSWNDGGDINWFCPDGSQFILGKCLSQYGHLDSADPIPTVKHMRLIGRVGASGTWVDVLASGGYTIPSGTGAQQFYLQTNDSDISNNKGSVSFNVCVQKAVDPATLPDNQTWCYTLDFTLSDYGFFAPSNGLSPDTSVWTSGAGFVSSQVDNGAGHNYSIIHRQLDFAGSTTITSVTLKFNTDELKTNANRYIDYGATSNDITDGSGDQSFTDATIVNNPTHLLIHIATDKGNPNNSGHNTLKRVIINGKGAIPTEFVSSNC